MEDFSHETIMSSEERKGWLKGYREALLVFRPPRLTLSTTMCYREAETDRYFHTFCMRYIQGKALPASLREVGWRDPVCVNCGSWILGQFHLGIYEQLLQKEGTTVEAEKEVQSRKEIEEFLNCIFAEKQQA